MAAVALVPLLTSALGVSAGMASAMAIGIGGVTTALSIMGTMNAIGGAADAEVATAEYNARVADRNAQVAERNAEQARLSSETAAAEIREDNLRRIGAIRASFAKAGVVTSEGTSLLAQLEQAEEGEYSAEKELYAGRLESQSRMDEAALFRSDAQYERNTIPSIKSAARSKKTSSILSGVSSFATSAGGLF